MSMDAWVALALPFLRGLRSLYFAPDYKYICRTLTRASQRLKPFDKTKVLTSLEEIYTGAPVSNPPLANQIVPWFNFPSLRKFCGESIEESDECCISKGSSSVTELELIDSTCGLGIKSLIESCKALKTFKYTHNVPVVNYEPSGTSLIHARESLEELWLDYYDFLSSPYNERHWIGSLKGFNRLRKLHIRLDNLFKWDSSGKPTQPLTDLLPPSLELLSITECFDAKAYIALDQLDILVKNRDTAAPHIKQIQIFAGFHHSVDADEWENLRSLVRGCAEGGIEFELRDFPLEEGNCMERDEFYMHHGSFWARVADCPCLLDHSLPTSCC